MGQRKPAAVQQPSGKSLEDVIACEVAGAHKVKVTHWPPPKTGATPGYFSLRCIECSTNVIVEEWHAEPNEFVEVIGIPKKQAV